MSNNKFLKYFRNSSKGNEAVEWWVLITCISALVMWTLLTWGENTNQTINQLNNTLNSVEQGI